jgi:hypothetical protein
MALDTVLAQKPLKSSRRRLKRADIKAVADLVVKYRMNETEAALESGIAPKTWFNFKQRHKTQEQFEVMINSIRASQLRNCIDSIDESGNDREFDSVTKRGEKVTVTKPGDWRAKAWIAERVLAPERLGQQQAQASTVQVNAFVSMGIDIAALLQQGADRNKGKVLDVTEVKQLPMNTGDK